MRGLGVVADDLTGAMDTAVQFARWGLHTVVMLTDAATIESDVTVVSTDSRNATADNAYRKVRDAARLLAGRRLYKKIDSTLRGNIGSELDALLDELRIEHALVAPAFPAAGRITVQGYQHVGGALLEESPFAGDPNWPAKESHVCALLRGQTRRSVRYLSLGCVEQGEPTVAERLASEPPGLLVADAAEQRHLRTLARALSEFQDCWLPCGSAGLAQEWVLALGPRRSDSFPAGWAADSRPVLVVAGSRHRATREQLERAAEEGVLSLVDFPVSQRRGEREAREAALLSLSRGKSVALTTALGPYRLEGDVVARLADATGWLLKRFQPAGLVLTGGETARAVCRLLDAKGIRVLDEVGPGIPAGVYVGGPWDGLRVVTKAGGFGGPTAISDSIREIQGVKG